ncbi:hypothetical protein F4X10_05460 [Candidatus Poribacteria bacterium]|nr:hypothetical protein [Candidatus Poribacteria bacterium]
MTEERKVELRQLLHEARQNVIIEAPKGYKRISVEEYREWVKAFQKSYRPDLSSILDYRLNIQDDAVKSKLFDFMKEELADYIREHEFEDESLDLPTYWIQTAKAATRDARRLIPCGLDSLLEKFLEIAIANGTEQAILALDRCTRETSGTFQKIIFLQDLRVQYSGTTREASKTQIRETHIAEGIKFVQLPSCTIGQIWDLCESEQSGFIELPSYAAGFPSYLFQESFILTEDKIQSWSESPMALHLSLFSEAILLIIDYTVSPLFCKPSVKSIEGVDISDRFEIKIKSAEFPNFDVDKFYHALSLIANYAVKPLFQWQYIDEDELFKVGDWWYTKLMRPRVMIDSGSGIHVINETDIDRAKCLYQLLTNPSSNIGEKLQIPIDRWIKSKTSQIPEDKIIDLAIALESLYLSNIPEPTELSFRLRLYAAWYLKEKTKDRKELMKIFNRLYDWRSAVIHNGKLPEKKISRTKKRPYTQEEISELITQAQDLCQESIIKILEDGEFPNWNSLILGEETT